MSLFLLCLSFRLWCLCFLDVFAVWLGSRKLWGAKCWYSQWQDEPYKSTELIDVMYDTVRDCFGKEAASYCKDTAIYCMCVCVCVSCKIAMKSQCQAIFCPSQQHWKNHCRYICVCWRRHRVNAMCPGSPPPSQHCSCHGNAPRGSIMCLRLWPQFIRAHKHWLCVFIYIFSVLI